MTSAQSVAMLNGATFANVGAFDLQSDAGFASAGGAPSTFNNAGILTKSAGTGVSDIGVTFNNAGGIVNINSGTLSLSAPDQSNGGAINIATGATFKASPGTFTNDTGGVIGGSGTVDASATTFGNSGTLLPGGNGTIGTLNILGNVTLNPSGTVVVDVGPTPAQHDVLAISGTGNLGGQLNVAYIGGYAPANGDAFVPVTFATSSGAFAAVNPAAIFTVTYNPTNVTLTMQSLNNYWIGASGNWATASNWSLGHVPTVTEKVVVDVAGLQTVTVSSGINSVLQLTSNENFSISGGSLGFSGGTSIFNSALNLTGGTLLGAGNVIANGAFNWSGGKLAGTGTFITNGVSTLKTPTVNLALNRNWINLGTLNWSGSNGRSLNIGSDGSLVNAAGGIVNLAGSSSSNIAGTGEFQNLGTLNKNGDATTTISASFSNSGTVDVNNGTLALSNSTGNDGGIEIASGATLRYTGSAYTNRATGRLSGTGTLNVIGTLFTNDGTIAPGNSNGAGIGTFRIVGDLHQGPTGLLQMGLRGTEKGQFDVVSVSGAAFLDGTLSASVVGACTPVAGDRFKLITYGSRTGTFANTMAPVGFSFTANYGSTSAKFTLQ